MGQPKLDTSPRVSDEVRKTTCSQATPVVHFNAATHRIAALV